MCVIHDLSTHCPGNFKCQLVVFFELGDFGIVEGPFQVTAIEYAGSHNGEATYELSMASAGALTFTAL